MLLGGCGTGGGCDDKTTITRASHHNLCQKKMNKKSFGLELIFLFHTTQRRRRRRKIFFFFFFFFIFNQTTYEALLNI